MSYSQRIAERRDSSPRAPEAVQLDIPLTTGNRGSRRRVALDGVTYQACRTATYTAVHRYGGGLKPVTDPALRRRVLADAFGGDQ